MKTLTQTLTHLIVDQFAFDLRAQHPVGCGVPSISKIKQGWSFENLLLNWFDVITLASIMNEFNLKLEFKFTVSNSKQWVRCTSITQQQCILIRKWLKSKK